MLKEYENSDTIYTLLLKCNKDHFSLHMALKQQKLTPVPSKWLTQKHVVRM